MIVDWKKIIASGLKIGINYVLTRKAKKIAKIKYINLLYSKGEYVNGVVYVCTDNIKLLNEINSNIKKRDRDEIRCYFKNFSSTLSEAPITYTYQVRRGESIKLTRAFLSYQDVLKNETLELLENLKDQNV
jgi:hypothetical protein